MGQWNYLSATKFLLIELWLRYSFLPLGRVTHMCVSTLCHHWLRWCRHTVNWNKPRWNYNRNSYFSIRKNTLENIVRKMAAILSRLQCAGIYSSLQASYVSFMMTSSNGNICRVTGHLCGEFTGPRWIPHTKASDAELWCFLSSASE